LYCTYRCCVHTYTLYINTHQHSKQNYAHALFTIIYRYFCRKLKIYIYKIYTTLLDWICTKMIISQFTESIERQQISLL